METEIIIKANLTDEQLEVLVSEIQSTAEMIGVDLNVESNKLSQHDVSRRGELLKAFVEFYNNRQNSYKRIYYDEIDIYLESL